MEYKINWILIVGSLLLLFPFIFSISMASRMAIKKRSLLLGLLTVISIFGAFLIGYATGVLPDLNLAGLICIGSLFLFIVLLVTGGIYWRLQWGRKRWFSHYSQLDIPDWFATLYKRMHDID